MYAYSILVKQTRYTRISLHQSRLIRYYLFTSYCSHLQQVNQSIVYRKPTDTRCLCRVDTLSFSRAQLASRLPGLILVLIRRTGHTTSLFPFTLIGSKLTGFARHLPDSILVWPGSARCTWRLSLGRWVRPHWTRVAACLATVRLICSRAAFWTSNATCKLS